MEKNINSVVNKILEGADVREALICTEAKKPEIGTIVKKLEDYLDVALAGKYGRSWDIISNPTESWIRVSDGNSDHTYTISVTPYYKVSLSEQLVGEIAKDGGDERDFDLSNFIDKAYFAVLQDFK